jgi:dihydroorotate dehydrogenase (NAD+) catalytic subunit
VVTNAITYHARRTPKGTRVIPMAHGMLIHTGIVNAGLRRVISEYREKWARLPVPLIVHVVALEPSDLRACLDLIENTHEIAAIELGISDDMPLREVIALTRMIANSELPSLVRLPFGVRVDEALEIADAGAGALTVCAPPRGTARDSAGKLVAGRIYSPIVMPMVLRLVGQIARAVPDVPVIACGGIASQADARDYIDAGAVAVQVDSLVWSRPALLESIARDLGGLTNTQPSGALLDEWMQYQQEKDQE